MEGRKQDPDEAYKGTCPQTKVASKQIDMTLKRQAKALVLKFRKRADLTAQWHVRGLVLKLRKQPN